MDSEENVKRKTVVSVVASPQNMRAPELHDQWRALFGTEPPACRNSVLVRRLAHRVQELAYGQSTDEVKRRVEEKRVAFGLNEMGLMPKRPSKGLKDMPVAGTRLIREWNEMRYEVTIMPDGFLFNGKTYRSLSAIAYAITGTPWNGRAFFGLSKKKSPRKVHNEK